MFSCLVRSEVFEEPDEKAIGGTHLHYTESLVCILVTALMDVSEDTSRSEVSYDLGGLSQLNLQLQPFLSPLKWDKKAVHCSQDLNELKPGDPDCCKMLPVPHLFTAGPEVGFAFSRGKEVDRRYAAQTTSAPPPERTTRESERDL